MATLIARSYDVVMMTTTTDGWHLSRSALQALGDRLRATVQGETPAWATSYRGGDFPRWAYTADTVGIAADAETGALEALLVVRGRDPFLGADAWPGGFVEQRSDADARAAVLRELREETVAGGVRYLEALDTYDGVTERQFQIMNCTKRRAQIIDRIYLHIQAPGRPQR